MTANGWSPVRKGRQRAAIHRWKPWNKSTGPKTVAGKQKVSRNNLKHGNRSRAFIEEVRALRQLLRSAL